MMRRRVLLRKDRDWREAIRPRLSRARRVAGMRAEPRLPSGPGFDLRGKRILLTGASSGIGAAAAEKLAAEGATLVLVARREQLLDEVAERVVARGGEALVRPTDLRDMEAVDELVANAGLVDVLINNAGRSIRRPFGKSLERWHDLERMMAINYFAPLRLIRGLAPAMIARGEGHVINVATWRVLPESSPLFSAYNASKAALSAASRVIDTEWGELGVRSTTIYYPLVATPMIAPTGAYEGMLALTAGAAADWMVTAARHRPVRIAPRMALTERALDLLAPRLVNDRMKRQTLRTKR